MPKRFATRSWLRAAGLTCALVGPSFKPVISQEALEGLSQKGRDFVPSPAKEQGRRSLYLYSRRGLVAPLLTTFDFCDTTQPCGQRDVSVVAPQALALMNGAFAHEQSQGVAERVASLAGQDSAARARAAWRIVLARESEQDGARGGDRAPRTPAPAVPR